MRALILVGLIGATVLAQAADLKATFQPIYTQFAKAQKAKDVKAMEAMAKTYFAKDAVFIHHDGRKQTGTEMFAELKGLLPSIGAFKACTGTVTGVVTHGNSADVTVVNHSELILNGPDGKPHTLVDDEKTVDTWQKAGGKWMLKLSKSISEKSTVDGKATG